MTTEDRIQALLAKAEPLRELADDDPAKEPLAGIVDEINALRSRQAKDAMTVIDPPAVVEGDDATFVAELIDDKTRQPEPPKRKPGRPKKGE